MLSLLLATTTLNPLPLPSEPCPIVSTPVGTMCKVAASLKVYGIIRAPRKEDAKAICYGMAGAGYDLWETAQPREWLCVKWIN